MSEDEKQYLTEEELEEYMSKSVYSVKRVDRNTLARMKNSIEKLEAEYNDVKALKNFITTGVLVSPQLILSAKPETRSLGMSLTALSNPAGFSSNITATTVSLRVEDVDRFIRMLPELLKAARLHRDFAKLRAIHKEHSQSSSRRRW